MQYLGLNLHASVLSSTLLHLECKRAPFPAHCSSPFSLCPQLWDVVVFPSTCPPLLVPSPSRVMLRCRFRVVTALFIVASRVHPHPSGSQSRVLSWCGVGWGQQPRPSLGSFRKLEAHACSRPGYCKTCFAGCFIKKSGT